LPNLQFGKFLHKVIFYRLFLYKKKANKKMSINLKKWLILDIEFLRSYNYLIINGDKIYLQESVDNLNDLIFLIQEYVIDKMNWNFTKDLFVDYFLKDDFIDIYLRE